MISTIMQRSQQLSIQKLTQHYLFTKTSSEFLIHTAIKLSWLTVFSNTIEIHLHKTPYKDTILMTKLNYKHSTTIRSETRVNVGENILKSQDTSNTHNTRLHSTNWQVQLKLLPNVSEKTIRTTGTVQAEDRWKNNR